MSPEQIFSPVIILFFPLALMLVLPSGYSYLFWVARNIWAPFVLFGTGFWIKKTTSFHTEEKSAVLIANHSSYLDIMLMFRMRKTPFVFVGKKELFNRFTGWFFTAMGGSPINRGRNENKVTAIAKVFNQRDHFRLAIAPEGTRKKVDRWRTGFYHISIIASVPILLVNFNYKVKKVSFSKVSWL